jgi:CubicO group peptidase (beta-lactamase class C family)
MKPHFAFVLLLALASPLLAAPKEKKPAPAAGNPETLADQIILPAMREKQLVGLALGVVKDGQVILRKGYGVKSLTAPGAPDADTIFYIASLSKAVTAVGFMRLVEAGKVSLTDPIGKYLPDLPQPWQQIKVAQAMAHQSGIPQLGKKLPTFEEMIASARTQPLAFSPGSKQEYNNFNFAIVGKLIEKISGQTYLDYMKQAVFDPLGMTRTGYGLEDANEAISYRPGTPPQPIDHRLKGGEYGIPSGHLQSTVNDLLRFYDGLRRHALLKVPTMQQMIARVQPNLTGTPGWFEQPAGEFSLVTKNGSAQGYHSLLAFVPRKGQAGQGQAGVMIWTAQKPEGNNLSREMKMLLNQICGVPTGPEVATGDDQ